MRDLHDLMTVIEFLVDRVEQVEEYSGCLEKILEISAIPPLMTLSSDILNFSRALQEYFAMLGI